MYQIGGLGQMSPAQQLTVRKAYGKSATGTRKTRKTKKKRVAKSARTAKKSRKRASGKRLVAGSAAAKAWGKKMKALRKKRK